MTTPTKNGMMQEAEKAFAQHFNGACSHVAAAPGRVNLIGEHTDYNDGFVLPMALDKGVYACVRLRDDLKVRVLSADYKTEGSFSLTDLQPGAIKGWLGYVAAVYWALKKEGYTVRGADMLLMGDLPQGTGLSSSAALELAVARAACALGNWQWDGEAMALLCQKAENGYVGVNCGIMDQFAVAVGEPHSALFLDCRTLAHESLPVLWKDAEFVVINSGVSRSLNSSKYNERREECDLAVRKLSVRFPKVASLRDATLEMLKEVPDDKGTWWRRARHVVSEDGRVLKALEALRSGDPSAFGKLMTESHASLKDDYEVSCAELDVLVETALAQEGCFGSRLTGAGFGGCTISLVAKEAVPAFIKNVVKTYRQATGKEAQPFVFKAGRTARLL
ncbi:MAG TPA: galactokinase [bacterium]|jgi:galactokinase|nr:galactokinase [bacterium]